MIDEGKEDDKREDENGWIFQPQKHPPSQALLSDCPVSNGFMDFIKNIIKNLIERASKDSCREIVSWIWPHLRLYANKVYMTSTPL